MDSGFAASAALLVGELESTAGRRAVGSDAEVNDVETGRGRAAACQRSRSHGRNGPRSAGTAERPTSACTGNRGDAPHEQDVLNIGKSVVFKGELSGGEDRFIEGTVEGKVDLREHVLTVGPHAKIKADVFAKTVIVLGEVVGNVTAGEKLDIRDSGSVEGDIVSPIVEIAEGAHLRGSVDMQKKPTVAAPPAQAAKPEVKLAPLPAGPPAAGGQRLTSA